jgi:hypothetical protein
MDVDWFHRAWPPAEDDPENVLTEADNMAAVWKNYLRIGPRQLVVAGGVMKQRRKRDPHRARTRGPPNGRGERYRRGKADRDAAPTIVRLTNSVPITVVSQIRGRWGSRSTLTFCGHVSLDVFRTALNVLGRRWTTHKAKGLPNAWAGADRFELAERRHLVAHCLAQLPQQYRDVVEIPREHAIASVVMNSRSERRPTPDCSADSPRPNAKD